MIRRIAALTLCLMCAASSVGAEELLFTGTVVAQESTRLTAPYGGVVESVYVREGERVDAAELVAQIASQRVFSSLDGTVRGIDAQIGESAAKTLFYIAPVSKFTINASVEKAFSSVETKYITVGERLFISCSKDGTHRAEGIVTAVNGLDFTVETDAGELYMEENVYLYRSVDYDKETRVGYGAVERTKEIAVSGTGSLLALHVEEGEFVERGQLLFETADATFAALEAEDGSVLTAQAGVIDAVSVQAGQSVQQGDTIATMHTIADYCVEITVAESWIREIHDGDSVIIAFFAGTDAQREYVGKVCGSDFVEMRAEDGSVSYQVRIAFEADEHIRQGLSASVAFGGV